MARPATGQLIEPTGTRKSWTIRYTVGGKRVPEVLGRPEQGWTRSKAEAVLRDRLDEIRLGVWKPKEIEPPAPVRNSAESFREFAESWFAGKLPELRPKTVIDYRWALELHLLPHFAEMPLEAITAEAVDAYRATKIAEGKLAPNAINKTLARMAQIMEVAVEYGRVERNPAKGKARRAKGTKPRWRRCARSSTAFRSASSWLRHGSPISR